MIVRQCPPMAGDSSDKKAQGRRLRAARERKDLETATDGANFLKVARDTYLQHENGTRSMSRAVETYAKGYDVPHEWLLYGRNPPDWFEDRDSSTPTTESVAVVGYVGAGAVATLYSEGQGPLDYVDPPAGRSPETVAVEVKGTSLGPAFDEALIFYDDVRSPVTPDLHGRLCVVGLPTGQVLVKILRAAPGDRFHLLSNTSDPPILDQEVLWAARVKDIRPR